MTVDHMSRTKTWIATKKDGVKIVVKCESGNYWNGCKTNCPYSDPNELSSHNIELFRRHHKIKYDQTTQEDDQHEH